jgi:hypothetical protein
MWVQVSTHIRTDCMGEGNLSATTLPHKNLLVAGSGTGPAHTKTVTGSCTGERGILGVKDCLSDIGRSETNGAESENCEHGDDGGKLLHGSNLSYIVFIN